MQRAAAAADGLAVQVTLDSLPGGMQRIDRHGMSVAALAGTGAADRTVQLVESADVVERTGNGTHDSGMRLVHERERQRRRRVTRLRCSQYVSPPEGIVHGCG